MKTKDFRAMSSVAQEDVRRKAVKAVIKGHKQVEVAEMMGITRQAVGGWVKTYREKGAKGLKAGRRGRPEGGRLTRGKGEKIRQLIIDRCPDQLKLPFYLWTRAAVGMLIERKYDIRVSVWTVGRYLARWGFTPQKPVRKAFEKDPVAVRRWLKREYPAIRKRAKREKAQIYWGDEMGMRSDHATGRTYGLKGRTPVIAGTGQRFGCQMISVITNRGKLYFMVHRGKFNARVFLNYLKRLMRQVSGGIYLIIDGHPVHRSRKVRQWAEEQGNRIKIYFLPGYSPELNPDEELNQDVKSNAVGRQRPHTQGELMNQVRGYLRKRQRQPEVVRKYFQEEHVRYAAM